MNMKPEVDNTMTRNAETPEEAPASRRRSRKLEMPWTLEQETLLHECESILASTELAFWRKGQALQHIRDGKLYEKYGYRSLATYCLREYGLKRSTVHRAIVDAETYEIVHNCTQFNPRHASQVRHLAQLDDDADKQAAWQHAVDLAAGQHRGPTEAQVKAAVESVKEKQHPTGWTTQFMRDHLFQGIPLRWELSAQRIQSRTVDTLVLQHLPKITPNTSIPSAPGRGDRPLVLICPDREYLTPALHPQSLQMLIAVCGSAQSFQYLLWTRTPEIFRNILVWPDNISVAHRVNRQADLDAFLSYATRSIPLDTLWLDPEEPLHVPAWPSGIKRLLIGNQAWPDERTSDEVLAMRQLTGACIAQAPSVAVHLATSILPMLYQV